MAIEELYSYENECFGNGKPQWFKLWVSKYYDALDIENLDKKYMLHIKSEKTVEERLLGRLIQDIIDVFEGTDINVEISETKE